MARRIQPHIMCGVGDIAKYVLMPGDPARVQRIASKFDQARKVAENRGYLTFTGTIDDVPISATSTGIGCPSAAIAVEELSRIGAEVLIRVGTAGGLQANVQIGDLVVATAATRTDGTTRAYIPPEYPALADPTVTNALVEAARRKQVKPHIGVVWTSDAFYSEGGPDLQMWSRAGVVAVEMECSTIFTLACLKRLKAGAILAVDGNLLSGAKKSEFEPGEKKGELDERVQEAVDSEIEIAIEAVGLLERSMRNRGRTD